MNTTDLSERSVFASSPGVRVTEPTGALICGNAVVTLDSGGRIASIVGPSYELLGRPQEELRGESWKALCSDFDQPRVAREAFDGQTGRIVVRLRPGGGEIDEQRMGEVFYAPQESGGWVWIVQRISDGAFPPLDLDDLRTLLVHCRHSLLGHVAAAAISAQTHSRHLVSAQEGPSNDSCERILHNLSLLEEVLDDCFHVGDWLLGSSSHQAAGEKVSDLLEELSSGPCAAGISAEQSSAFASSARVHSSAAANRGPLLRLARRLLRLCERFSPPSAGCTLEVSCEGPSSRLIFSGPGLRIPEAVTAILNDPLILHGTKRRESSHYFEAFLIGLLSRRVGAKLEVVQCAASGASSVTLILPEHPTDTP